MSNLDLKILKNLGAITKGGHFVYTSGKHGKDYVQKDILFMHPTLLSDMASSIAQRFLSEGVQIVAGPAYGAIALASHVALYLTRLKKIGTPAVYLEEVQGNLSFNPRRPFASHVKGRNVLVVEDVLNTGTSARKVVQAVREAGGIVENVAAICNRGGVKADDLDVKTIYSLIDLDLEMWDAVDCPLCRSNIPVNTDMGHGKEFLENRR